MADVTKIKATNGTIYNIKDANAASADHSHSLSMSTSTGTSAISLEANKKYQLSAGGSTYIFTTPPGSSYVFDGTYDASTNKAATVSTVTNAINALPEPMIFKGSLGSGGTITSLPSASSSNTGFTYKVITAGTYASQSAKVGDTFISDGSSWILIPSGDEPSGTVTSITIDATSPISINSSSAITTSGSRTISHANSGVTAGTYKSVTVNATGHVTAGTNPTTLSGYGITDAKIANGVITLGSNTITPLTSGSTLDATKLSGTIPSGCYTDTNNAVTQTATSTSANYEVLFSATADNTTRTEGARKSTTLKFNPSTGNLQTTQINGVDVGSSPKFTDTVYEHPTYTAATAAAIKVGRDSTGHVVTGNALTASDVGLGNVGNFKAVSTVASQGLSSTEQSNARANIGAGTSNLAIGTTATTAAAGNHTHATTIATSTATNQITLAYGTKYSLKAGGTSYIFTMPSLGTTSTTAAAGDHTHSGYLTGITSSDVTTALGYTPGTSNLTIGTSSTTAAAGNHTHTLTLASDTGTSGVVSLSHGGKYKLTAGGNSVIFTLPSDNDTNYYHTTGSWSGLTYTATANGGAGALAFTIPTGTTSTTVAKGDHTHSGYATTASPTFTGTPAAPTATSGTNTTQIATTAFVQGELGSYVKKTGDTMTGNLVISKSSPNISFNCGVDSAHGGDAQFNAIYHNGSNLWIGGVGDNSHVGMTVISSGFYPQNSGSNNGEPYDTIYVRVPEGFSHGGSNYGVWHAGNLDPTDYVEVGKVTVDSTNLSSTSLATGTAKAIGSSFTIPAGKWIVTVCVRYNANSTGYRQAWIATTSTGDAIAQAAKISIAPASGDQTFCHFSYPISLSSNTTYYVIGKQNCGSALGALGYVRWFGIEK